MALRNSKATQTASDAGKIGDLDAAAKARRSAELKLSMSERLARVHALCQQMSAVKNAPQAR